MNKTYVNGMDEEMRNRLYDSLFCSPGHWLKKCEEKTCPDYFESIRADAKFCSNSCRQRSYRKRINNGDD